MKKKSLMDTNLYLRDPQRFRKALIANVSSSTAIETGASISSIVRVLEQDEKLSRLTKGKDSGR